MKRALFAVIVLFFLSAVCFSQTVNEVEPNGCITMVGGDDAGQTLNPLISIIGSVSTSDSEGCLYFSYDIGDEYIEDLYALNISQSGYYAVSLLFYGYVDADVYLMKIEENKDLTLLNPNECGDYTCGITCGNPELVNVYLDPGTYIIGVSVATVYYCFEPGPTDYFLSVAESAQGERPVVTSLNKAANPFRLFIMGNNFYSGTRVVISGNEWTNFKLDGSDMIILKKGASLKSMFPKDGSWVPITIISGTNQSTTILYNRLHNLWQDGGVERGE